MVPTVADGMVRAQLMAGQADPPARQQTRPGAPPRLRWSRDFPGDLSQVRQTRHWIKDLFPACGELDDLLEIASELATNALKHTRSGLPGGWFSLDLLWSPEVVRIMVSDQGSEKEPAVAEKAAEDGYLEGGHGLLLVQNMSMAWGIAGNARARWVWADVRWLPAYGPLPTVSGRDPAVLREAAALRRTYPGIPIWFGAQTRTWWAALPEVADTDGLISAESPADLNQMLAARYPPSRRAAQPGDALRFTAAPVPGQAGPPSARRPGGPPPYGRGMT
jgi:serine/threonine-protein kinase RsbW